MMGADQSSEQSTSFQDYDLGFLRDEYLFRFEYEDSDFEQSRNGLMTFFEIVRTHPGPHAVTNKMADDLWHTFILFTPQYRAFCYKYFRRYIDHQPNTQATPVVVDAFLNFFKACSEKFGFIPDFWTRDIPASLLSDLLMGKRPVLDGLRWSGWTG